MQIIEFFGALGSNIAAFFIFYVKKHILKFRPNPWSGSLTLSCWVRICHQNFDFFKSKVLDKRWRMKKLKIVYLRLKMFTQEFSGSLITNLVSDLQNSRWRKPNFNLREYRWKLLLRGFKVAIRNQRPRKSLSNNFHRHYRRFKFWCPLSWIRHLEFFKSYIGFVISNIKNLSTLNFNHHASKG